ncbi:MAG TPA: hypothetical protein VL202_19205 [Pararhizobium sp.]|uniref:hypothetical protein n=1 Tax=Pararhizobium sp. TaxID=1977563 RepID=UPI002BF8981B|nr:hypothetical protein [Pararhizobium sp.]HTO33280.1 hypothetical protein [Pararhizobium sp.]
MNRAESIFEFSPTCLRYVVFLQERGVKKFAGRSARGNGCKPWPFVDIAVRNEDSAIAAARRHFDFSGLASARCKHVTQTITP